MLASRAARTLAAAVYFALLARKLGIQSYGAFAGTCALASILAPFASLGSGNLLIRAVAQDRSAFSQRWGDALMFTGISGTVLTVVGVAAARFVLPNSIANMMLVNICVADLIFARLLDLTGMAFQSIEMLHMTAWFSLSLTLSRLGAAVWLVVEEPRATAMRWSALYLASTASAAIMALVLVQRRLGAPTFDCRVHRRDLVDGSSFSISLAAQTVYNDIDKTMLARMVSLEAAGVYGAAYRIVDAAFSPVNALMHAAYPRFFQHGAQGLTHSTRFATRLLPRVLVYCVGVGTLAYMAAPWVPKVLGAQFEPTVVALRWLAPVLVFRGVHVFAADALTGAEFQGTRTMLQFGIAMANVMMNLAWLPRFSWRGACYATLLCDGLLAVTLWSTILVLCRRQRRSNARLVMEPS